MNELVDGGAMIFAALILGIVLSFVRWYADNKKSNRMADEIRQLESEMRKKRIHESDRFREANRVYASEIADAVANGRISGAVEFVALNTLTRQTITGKEPDAPKQKVQLKSATVEQSAYWGDYNPTTAPISNPPSTFYAAQRLAESENEPTVAPEPETPPEPAKRRKRRAKLNHKNGARQSISEILTEVHDDGKGKRKTKNKNVGNPDA